MTESKSWLGAARRAFHRSSCKTIAVDDVDDHSIQNPLLKLKKADHAAAASRKEKELSAKDIAAIKIQSYFRGHLARCAFRALRSLVKLQAMVRGAYVRRQSCIAVHCMQVLVRLQVRIRARQLLKRSREAAEPPVHTALDLFNFNQLEAKTYRDHCKADHN